MEAAPLNEPDGTFLSSLGPDLRMLEQIRLDKLDSYRRRRKIAIFLTIVMNPISVFLMTILFDVCKSDNCIFSTTLTIIPLLALWAWVSEPKKAYSRAYRGQILPRIAQRLGPFKYDPDGKMPMAEMKPSRIIPFYRTYEAEDYFEATYRESKIRFCEIAINAPDSKSTSAAFRGLAILISMRRKFLGHTILIKEAPIPAQLLEGDILGLKRANLVDPEFERMFTVYTNDQVEARYLLDSVTIERFKKMAEIYGATYLSAAYYDNQLLILIPSKVDFFEPAPIDECALDKGTILKIAQEIEHILFLTDQLALYRPAERPEKFH